MKFLCPSCKAKYQIADEKVRGRAVKMKCRKCGHVIHVSESGGAASGDAFAAELDASATGTSSIPPSERISAPAPARISTPAPALAPAPVRTPAPAPRSPQRAAPPPRPAAAPAPRAPAPRAPAPRAPAPSRVAPPPRQSAQRPAPVVARGVGVSALGGSAAAPAAVPIRVEVPQPAPELARSGNGALAGAFAAEVVEGAAPHFHSLTPGALSGDEWFVGINGVPVGPMRLSQLRSKASLGIVTPDSLVWHEGFEEWKALKTFPELLAVVEEGVSSVRASASPPSPGLSGAAAAVLADPFAIPLGVGDTTAKPTSSSLGASLTDDELVGIPTQRRTPAAAWLALVVAIGLGASIMWAVMPKKKEIVYVQVPGSAPVLLTAPQAAQAAPVESALAEAPGNTPAQRAGNGHVAAKKVDDKATPAPAALPGLKDLGGLQPGPSSGSNVGATVHSGQPLDSDTVQRTVSRYTSSVKRGCWQPALDTRDKDAPTSARVMVTITVAPGGSVQNVSTSGDPRGYRGLASCIASRVRGWSFPPSGDSTTVNVPFVFAAQ